LEDFGEIDMEKTVLLDFCGTVVNFQTFDPFIEYVLRNERPISYKLICNPCMRKICYVLTKIQRFMRKDYFLYKVILVRCLKGMHLQKIQQNARKYYNVQIQRNFIMPTVELIEKLRKAGYRIILLSGGSKWYIDYFAGSHGIKDVISTELEIKDGLLTGKIKKDCVGEEKIEMLKEYISKHKLNVSFEIGITDSSSDIPMLNLCKRKIVLSKERHQEWLGIEMEEIIWN